MYDTLLQESATIAPVLAALFATLGAVLATVHLLLYRADERASLGWLGLIWITPLLGVILYIVFGISRVERQAKRLRRRFKVTQRQQRALPQSLAPQGQTGAPELEELARVGKHATGWPLFGGNRVTPLRHGEEAYPAMLQAIDQAKESVALLSFIFDNDPSGLQFADALARAHERGVAVRVLVDAAGARYTWPTILHELKKRGVPCARFLPTSLMHPLRLASVNLRNHRKLMIVDGTLGFTGGMNIRHACMVQAHDEATAVQDTHFRLQGPVVSQLQGVFLEDWLFSTKEELHGPLWVKPIEPAGQTFARGVPDGPDEEVRRLRWVILGALSCAHTHVRILSPYFVPDEAIRQALVTTSQRGVQVEVLLPRRNNLPYMTWAAMSKMKELLENGVHVRFAPGPFDHTKLMLVDAQWGMLGSGNWDSRSFRLNFEFNVEFYDAQLAADLMHMTQDRFEAAEPMTLEAWHGRHILVKLRDALVGLGAPYL